MTPERGTEVSLTPDGTAFAVAGGGEPLVLVHGVGMQHGVWAPQIAALARKHQVVVYDMLGHGASRLPPPGATLADYAAQLEALLDHLGIAAANVAGHSMGALVVLEFALRHPARALRVAALNAVFRRTPEQRTAVQDRAAMLQHTGVQATLGSTMARWFGDPVPAALQAMAHEVGSYLQNVQPAGYAHTYGLFASSDEAHAGRLQHLSMPTLFLTGEHDANSTPEMSLAMGGEAPCSTVEVIAGARHMMNVTTPDAVNQSFARWLARPRIG
ncbi:3-oxoadipate enol-lactonase 2 [Variovorax sp. SRS16]|uniref:alpha/beta fold hydrolase n=1 Tax=Variovorax sp. SRS16 TaxID=282217 RepID=UPI001316075C|nr:alpha/beta fold hydrolase [Variovorax sp. SRS16]VTU18268.1 3-oxoadipate enol-lactonase 2 [Variovorax sp. SRS16]